MQPVTALVKATSSTYIVGDSLNISSRTLTRALRSSYNINKRYNCGSASFLFDGHRRLAGRGWGGDVPTDTFIVYISFFVNVSVHAACSVRRATYRYPIQKLSNVFDGRAVGRTLWVHMPRFTQPTSEVSPSRGRSKASFVRAGHTQ